MATPTRQWVRIAILALLGSTLAMAYVVKPPTKPPADMDHVVKARELADMDHEEKPPTPVKLRKLQMDASAEDQMGGSGASAPASGCGGSSQADQGWEEEGGGRGGGIYGGGHGSGGTTFGFHKINPFPAFPFGAFVPEVSTWGEGGGYGGSNSNANSAGTGTDTDRGMGVRCHCSNGYAMHYTMTPINFQPMDKTKRAGPDDMAPSSSP